MDLTLPDNVHRVQVGAEPLRVGLVGAGPWARAVHAPGLTAHPRFELAGITSRRPASAAELAGPLGVPVFEDPDALIDAVDVLAFAVPPAVQAPLATRAAAAGRHVLLDKPIASTSVAAEALAAAVTDSGVASIVVLTRRFAPDTRAWLADVTQDVWSGGTARWLAGALIGGPYAGSAWRREHGALLDVGPHVLDLLDAALGEITGVDARLGPGDLWQLRLGHAGGAVSTATISLRIPVRPSIVEIAVVGPAGVRALHGTESSSQDCYAILLDEFAAMIAARRPAHPCDVHRGLHLQRLLGAAQASAGAPTA